jgi:hypothetical protein
LIPEDHEANWTRQAAGRQVPKSMIWQAYHDDTVHPIERFHANYPADLRTAIQDEEARIRAQFAEATPEAIEESNREQLVLESLEAHEDLKNLPDFLKEIQERKRRLLTVIRSKHPSESLMSVENTSGG